MPFSPTPRLLLMLAGLAALAALPGALADDPASQDPAREKIEAAAEQIASATTEREQDALLASAGAEVLQGGGLADALGKRQHRLTLAGDYKQAETIGQFLLRLADHQGNDEQRAVAQTRLGAALVELGEYGAARPLQEAALRYYEAHPDKVRGQASACIGLAILHLNQADFARALALLNRALALSEAAHWHEGIIPAWNTMGNVYRAQGQQERALDCFERARHEVGDDTAWNMAFLFNNIGQSYELLGDTDRAIAYINRAREVAERVKFRPRVATSLAVLGKLHLDRKETDLARRDYAASLALSLELHDALAEGRARLGLAETARAAGDYPLAIEHADAAAALYRRTGQRTELSAARVTAGRCLRAQRHAAEAKTAFEEAIAEIERAREQVAGGAEESERFFEDQVAPYQELVALLVEENRPAEALRFAERTSARTLLDILAVGSTGSDEGLTDAERGARHDLNLRLATLNRTLGTARAAEPPDGARTAAIEAGLRAARLARENFETGLSAAHPASQRLQPPASAPDASAVLADAARSLASAPGAALLRFAVTPEKAFLFVLRAGPGEGGTPGVSLKVFPLDADRATLARRTEGFRAALSERALTWQSAGNALYASVLRSSEESWRDASTLIVVPDGPLWELPFQALPLPSGQTLLAKYPLRIAPSIAFLARPRPADAAAPAPPGARLLAFGNPDLGDTAPAANDGAKRPEGQWEPLPDTAMQVEALRKLYPPGQSRVFVGADAKESVAKREMARCDVLHFATHGVLNSRNPLYSYLLLSQGKDDNEDGLLEAWELMRLPVGARLAVLSACETARGRVGDGEGVIGLSWALLAAGCPACVVSQWKVDSESSTALMVEFHRQLLAGTGRAEALRRASLSLAAKPETRHPFYWAPFVLVGDGT